MHIVRLVVSAVLGVGGVVLVGFAVALQLIGAGYSGGTDNFQYELQCVTEDSSPLFYCSTNVDDVVMLALAGLALLLLAVLLKPGPERARPLPPMVPGPY